MKIGNFEQLKYFLSSKTGLRMAHIYKPAMLLTMIRNGGAATKADIARDFLLRDTTQVEYYRRKIVHPMPGKRLVRDGLIEKDGDEYRLAGVMGSLSTDQLREIEEILEDRISGYLDMRNPFGDSNLDAIPGSVRYSVLKEAGGRCEACGVSSRQTQIDVDHIVPRSKGGSNDVSNLQALCRTCNSQKRDLDDTDFRALHEGYKLRDRDCPFCGLGKRVIDENELAVLIEDGYAITPGHSLAIPKRHVADYFDLYQAEQKAIDRLLRRRRERLLKAHETVLGFNVGVNAGVIAGQTIMHAHVHLIPRRKGDVDDPRGGVRHLIPGKGFYQVDN